MLCTLEVEVAEVTFGPVELIAGLHAKLIADQFQKCVVKIYPAETMYSRGIKHPDVAAFCLDQRGVECAAA